MRRRRAAAVGDIALPTTLAPPAGGPCRPRTRPAGPAGGPGAGGQAGGAGAGRGIRLRSQRSPGWGPANDPERPRTSRTNPGDATRRIVITVPNRPADASKPPAIQRGWFVL